MSTSPMKPPPWGVCLSGGGIRSASFCLGALQEMQRFDPVHPLIQGSEAQTSEVTGGNPHYVPGRADFITSVSGGSYIASALIFVAQGPVDGEPDVPQLKLSQRDSAETTDVVKTVTVAPADAFAAGSPEERYLRDHTRYLSHGFGGPIAAVWQLLVSIGLNLILLSLAVMVVAVPIGWLYGHLIPALQAGSQVIYHFSFSNAGWPLVPAIAGGAALLLAFVWVVAVTANPGVNKILLGTSLALVGVVLAWLCFAVALPIVLEWLHRSVGSTPTGAAAAAPSSTTKALGAAAGTGTAASVLIALLGTRVARTVKAGWDDVPKGIKGATVAEREEPAAAVPGPADQLAHLPHRPVHPAVPVPAGRSRGRSLPGVVPGRAGPGTPSSARWRAWGCWCSCTSWRTSPSGRSIPSTGSASQTRSASSDSQLEDGTDIAKVREDKKTRNEAWLPTEVDGQFADHRPYVYSYEISAVQPGTMPQLIVCASANVSTYGATPTGFRSTSFVFSKDKIGGGLLGHVNAQAYEAVVTKFSTLRSTVTLPAAVAISGAAVSPEMGRATRAPLRFLLTLANVRLGVWIPNPMRLTWFEDQAKKGRFRRSLVKPRMQHLLYEMVGKNKLTHNYLYVTDGGHYENLGLLEQLRMKSRYIFCLDASGERQDGFSTIAAAISLAYSEEQIRIDIRPELMAPDAKTTDARAARHLPPVVASPFCVGNIYYPDDRDEPSGRLVIIKAGVPAKRTGKHRRLPPGELEISLRSHLGPALLRRPLRCLQGPRIIRRGRGAALRAGRLQVLPGDGKPESVEERGRRSTGGRRP